MERDLSGFKNGGFRSPRLQDRTEYQNDGQPENEILPNDGPSTPPPQPDPNKPQDQNQPQRPRLADWGSVQNKDWNRAWTDFVTMQYGQGGGRAGFANMPSGGVQQAVKDFNDATGANARWISDGKGDKVDFGNGAVDVVQGAGTANPMLWNQALGGNNGQGPSGPPAGGTGTMGGGPQAGGPQGSGLANSGASQNYQKLVDLLMGRAQQSLDIDPTKDSVIRPQVDNYAAAQERSRRNYLNDMAESSNPYATGAMNTARTQTAEHAAQSTADLQSTLVGRELQSRRGEIQQALQEMGQLLTSDQQMALQRELAQIDASLRQQQINSNNDQFNARLGLDAEDRANYWDWKRSGGRG